MADTHSYANPNERRVRHVDLDLHISFEQRRLRGCAVLALEGGGPVLSLDTRDLTILKVNGSTKGFTLHPADPILGSKLTINLAPGVSSVAIEYETAPQASALQWLEPAQTAGKQHPFLFTQSQAIHARSWVPLQDSPAVRITFSATVHAPEPLTTLMAAERIAPGRFHMPYPIPPYLLALAVGDLRFQAISERCGIWAEPSVLPGAAKEFEDVERMVQAAEKLFGPYPWGRYDLLVMPPSFPFGGMENPTLTFATPTVIAGDKSLVSLVSHELAHSWSGNLVTNADWSDFWLNEGFTTYSERRIQEALYGKRQSEMEFALEIGELKKECEQLTPEMTKLVPNLKGLDPDENMTLVPYVKGALLLRTLEERYGRAQFDRFLAAYFHRFSFQSITTADFLDELHKHFPPADVSAWLNQPGIPADAAKIEVKFETSPRLEWSTQDWLHWLRALPAPTSETLAEIDSRWHLTRTGNSEIAAEWFSLAIRAGYQPAFPALRKFLVTVGRRKFVKPLFDELWRQPQYRDLARDIYKEAQPGYHPITQSAVDALLQPSHH